MFGADKMVELGNSMYILVTMPIPVKTHDDPWLKWPLRTATGTINLAGTLRDVPGLDPRSMRVLGRYALVFIVSGEGFYTDANGARIRFGAGHALVLFPDLPHAYGPDPGEGWEQIYVVFDGPQFNLLDRTGVLLRNSPLWRLGPVDYWRRRIEDLFRPTRQVPAAALRTIGQFVHLLTDMATTHAEATRPPGKAWLTDSMQLLAEPTERGWLNPKEVAGNVGLSYENFRKLFARHTGDSPGRFQKRRRIERACAAIYQGKHSFKEIADELGFCDLFHFSKAFRHITGETPSSFRKKARGV